MNNLSKFIFVGLALLISIATVEAQWSGNSGSTGNIYRSGNVGIGNSTSPAALLTLSANSPVLRFERTGSLWDYEIYCTGGGQLRFRGGPATTGPGLTDYMTLKGGGQVMIGTYQAPGSLSGKDISKYKLYVAGGILSEEVMVKEGWADYVFEKDYKLISLEEVEAHIQMHGHLPNTPSAKEIEDGGLNLGEMTVKQQEKIEELFLHVISLEKKIEELMKLKDISNGE